MGEQGTRREPQTWLARGIRASRTRSTAVLWGKSLLNALLFLAVFMVALPWVAHRVLPQSLPLLLETPLAATLRLWAAALLAGIGIAGWVWGLDVFSRRGRGTPFPLDAPRRLAVDGPFARVRNPIMAGELAVIWGVAAYLGSLGVLLYAVGMTLAARWLVVRVEEPELRERFGADYDAYCARVPRWIPRVSRRRPPSGSGPGPGPG